MRFKKLKESLNNKEYYYVCDKELIGDAPWANEQGVHVAQDLYTCWGVVDNRKDKYQSPHFYKFHISTEVKPAYFNDDYGYWDAKNISQMILDGVCESFTPTDDEIRVLKKYASLPNGKSTESDLFVIADILKSHGFNCIEYVNTFEGKADTSFCLFSNEILIDKEEIPMEIAKQFKD